MLSDVNCALMQYIFHLRFGFVVALQSVEGIAGMFLCTSDGGNDGLRRGLK